MIKKIKTFLWRYTAAFLIFNQFFSFYSQAFTLVHDDEQYLHDVFGEEEDNNIIQIIQNARELLISRVDNGAYAINLYSDQVQDVINFMDFGRRVGTWIENLGDGFFIGSNEVDNNIYILSMPFHSSLHMKVGGYLRFSQYVTLTDAANIESQSLIIDGIFFSQFSIQDKMEVFGNLKSNQRIPQGTASRQRMAAIYSDGNSAVCFIAKCLRQNWHSVIQSTISYTV